MATRARPRSRDHRRTGRLRDRRAPDDGEHHDRARVVASARWRLEYGGWQPLDGTPFSDASFGLAVSQQAGVVNKSVSYFSQSATWRMKVRAYKFKTEFEWSDWVQFKVDQH